MLSNPIYRGQIVHKDARYAGEHDTIIDQDLWEAVQTRLAGNRVERRNGAHAAEASLLAGLLHDDQGNRVTPSHATKRGAR